MPGGVVAMIVELDETATAAADTPPMVTVVLPLTKPVPFMVTEVPPIVGPEEGEILITEGAAT